MKIGSLIITGASRGIGLEFVKQFASLPSPPSRIFAACRNPDQATDLRNLAENHSSIELVKLDVTNEEDIAAVVKHVQNVVGTSGLNVLINNAAINDKGQKVLDKQCRETILKHYNTNVVSPIILSQQFSDLLKRAASQNATEPQGLSKALIVNISSIMGSIGENPENGGFYPYRTSKSALNMATHLLKLELGEAGISVVALHPGWTQTDMGGANAAVPCDQSVAGMISVLMALKKEQNGKLIDFTGRELVW